MNVCVNSTTPTPVSQLSSSNNSSSNQSSCGGGGVGGTPTPPSMPVISASNSNNNNNSISNNNNNNNNGNSTGLSLEPAMTNCAEISTSTAAIVGTILPDSMTFSPPELSIYDIIQCVAQAHRGHCTYTTELVKELNRVSLVNYSEKHDVRRVFEMSTLNC